MLSVKASCIGSKQARVLAMLGAPRSGAGGVRFEGLETCHHDLPGHQRRDAVNFPSIKKDLRVENQMGLDIEHKGGRPRGSGLNSRSPVHTTTNISRRRRRAVGFPPRQRSWAAWEAL